MTEKGTDVKHEVTVVRTPEELYKYTQKIAKRSSVDLDKLCEGLNAK